MDDCNVYQNAIEEHSKKTFSSTTTMNTLHSERLIIPQYSLEQEQKGVFYDERVLRHFVTRTAPRPASPKKPEGSGVFFENSEVKQALHPLQQTCKQSHCEHSMRPIMPCPPGQPLVAPPVLATSIITEETQYHSPFMHQQQHPPRALHQPGESTSWGAQRRKRGATSDAGDSLLEIKRSVIRQRLHSRDYRLSTDELVFVEAAAKLSEPPAPLPQKPKGVPLALPLKKPSLPAGGAAAANHGMFRHSIDLAMATQHF